jgi:GBP family porin
MQKKIIALAIAGLSSAAFAQSNVTISGLFDTGIRQSSTEAATGVKTTTTHYGSSSNTATTNVTFAVTEDLGGGMKAGVVIVTEPAAGVSNAVGFANSQNYLWLGGKFGEVKAGFFNNIGLEAALAMQPFGTAYGGGYSAAFGRLMGAGDTTTAANTLAGVGSAGTRLVRTNNAIQYKSPNFSGFEVSALMHNKNSDAGVAAADATGETLIGASYANGPLNVKYVNAKFNSGSATSILGAGGSGKHNLLGANYTFGPATVYAGWSNSSTDMAGAKVVDNTAWNIALKYTAGNIAFLANYLQDNDKLAANADRKLTGLGLDYSMSKRTTAYVRYETFDNHTNATGGKNTNTSVGLRHTF